MTKKKKNTDVQKDLESDNKTINISMEIDYHLSPEELAENKETLTEVMDDKDALIIAKKKAAKAYKSQIDLKETDIIVLRDAIRTKTIKKTVDVAVVINFQTGKKIALHPQTGEVLWEKDLTSEDRQMKMF